MKKLTLALAVCATLASAAASAEVRINGFASIVAGKTLDSDATLYGYDDEISFKEESMFALQLSADLQEKLTATAQIVASGENNYDAEFEWAYLTYEFNDGLQLSAGKMRAPFYKYSDFLDVGYAYRWVRTPQSVYSLDFSTYEGLSLLHTSQLGDWDSSVQVVYGSFDDEAGGARTILDDFAGVNWSVSRDWFSARAGYFVADTSVVLSDTSELKGLVDLLSASGFGDQADSIDIDGDRGTFLALGMSVDYNNILVDAEFTKLSQDDNVLPDESQYYVSVGYRLDDTTIHFTYEDNDDSNGASDYDQLPQIPMLNAAVNGAFASMTAKSNVYTIGARYDFHPSAAFKIDLSRFKDKVSDTETDVLSVGVDLVF
ncbi:porin [Pseudoalteromonas marina]|uniref:Porin n=1 Tax=Pseudoalteromonas marina TaxID=267375 RepID=A0ABT9FCH5_9GAMM|nr:porin [Pseudoalteromonas marina]MDP2564490.1 porin [Pseudoalteromonas marina]